VLKLYLLPFKRSAEALFGGAKPEAATTVAPTPAPTAVQPEKLAA